MSEEWKWIKGYEGLYMVSDHGRIKSFRKNDDGYILSMTNKMGDYLRLKLCDGNKLRKTISIHVLVANTFIGEIPPGWHVHHIDGNKQNNTVSNLEIVHPKDHILETQRMHPQIVSGMVYYNKYVRPREVLQYTIGGVFLAAYPNAKEASLATGICHRNILQVAAGTPYDANGNTRKQAGGYVWKFTDESEAIMGEIQFLCQ